MTTVVTGSRARRLLIASVALAVFMGRLDIYVVNVALPTIGRDFSAGTAAVAWVPMASLLVSCGLMLPLGRVADRAGARRLFVTGYAVFTLGSLLCGLSTGIWMLVACRCLQGVGGALLVIMTYTITSRFLPADRVGGAMGVLATFGALGIAVGSPLGGFLTETLSWRAAFFLNVPVGAAAIALAWWSIPASGGADGADEGGIDYAGAALAFVAVAALVVLLNRGEQTGWLTWPSAALLATVVVAGWFFVWRQRHAACPLIAPAVLRDGGFVIAVAVCMAGLILMGGNTFLMPFFLELEKGLSPAQVGLVLLVYSVAFMALSPLTGRLADRHAPWRLCALGMCAGTVVCLALALTMGSAGIAAVIAFLLGLAVAYSLFMAPNTKQVLQSTPIEHRGIGSAVYATFYSLSLLLGVTVFELLYSRSGAAGGSGAAAASGAAGARTDAAGTWWVPGFSGAYVAGAVTCAVAAVLCLAIPLAARHHDP